jgi:hypothetical protein
MDPHACFLGRYSLLSMPALAAIYLIAGEYLDPRARTIAQFGLAAVIVACTPVNYEQGFEDARLGRLLGTRFLADVQAGKPLPYVLHRNQWMIPGWDGPAFNSLAYLDADSGLRLLHDAGVPNFVNLRVDLPPSDLELVYSAGARPKETSAPAKNIEPALAAQEAQDRPGSFSIELKRPQRVRAILVLCAGPSVPGDIHVDFDWRLTHPHSTWTDGGRDWVNVDGTIYNCVAATWIDETIDRFRVECRSPDGVVQIRKVGLLIAAVSTPPQFQVDNLFFRFRYNARR